MVPTSAISRFGQHSLRRWTKSICKTPKQFLSTTPRRRNDDVQDPNPVIIEKDEAFKIMSIGINRPNKRNCVNKATANLLFDAFNEFNEDDDYHVAVLHGIGGNFCAGYDLTELASLDKDDIANEIAMDLFDRGPMGPSRMEFQKPVIAAITGYCVAGGLELALMCDLRVMEETAKIGFLNRRFGVPLIDGGSVRTPELIGLSRALDLIITGRLVEAKEATQMGLVNRMCKVGTAYGKAMEIAREVSRFPQDCLRVDRISAYHATFASKSLEESLQFESENALHVISKESVEGAQLFIKGSGRHGKFNVTPMAEKEDWEVEREAMEKSAAEETTVKDTDNEETTVKDTDKEETTVKDTDKEKMG